MVSIIKEYARTGNVLRFISDVKNVTDNSYYITIGKNDAWSETITDLTDDPSFAVNYPPKDDISNEKDIHHNMIAAKRVTASDIASAIPKFLWQTGTTYVPWDDKDEDIFTKRFYALTEEFKVYKCILAGSGASTVQPTHTNVLPTAESDGYTWKYMYTVPVVDATKFITDDYMPCKTVLYSVDLESAELANYNSQENSKAQLNGAILRVVVTNGGSGYTSLPTVTIEGDGTGATATAVHSPAGAITSINITNRGSGYNSARILLSGGGGSNAAARAVISPGQGHGTDPENELGASFCLIPLKFEENDGEDFFPGTDFRQLSLIKNPLNQSNSAICTDSTRNCLRNFTMASHSNYVVGDVITGANSGAKAIVDRYDSANAKLYFHQNFKTGFKAFTTGGETITGALGGTGVSANNGINQPEMKKFSGQLIAVSHRNKITRSAGTGQIGHFIIQF